MNPKVDEYLSEGCGRCKLAGTPDCKVHNWQPELEQLRMILLDCGLTEERKWGMPCYTFQKKNVLIMGAFKEYCALNFFKGSLLNDPHGILVKPSENTEAGRQLRFTDVEQIMKMEYILKTYIFDAMEKADLMVKTTKPSELKIPEEFKLKMDEIPALKSAFYELTPGRQKGYIFYFSQAKQSKTRNERVEKYLVHILNGKGLNDR